MSIILRKRLLLVGTQLAAARHRHGARPVRTLSRGYVAHRLEHACARRRRRCRPASAAEQACAAGAAHVEAARLLVTPPWSASPRSASHCKALGRQVVADVAQGADGAARRRSGSAFGTPIERAVEVGESRTARRWRSSSSSSRRTTGAVVAIAEARARPLHHLVDRRPSGLTAFRLPGAPAPSPARPVAGRARRPPVVPLHHDAPAADP